jgi:NADPH:quinone reductase-like Zn-dependent oxidoreductase
MPVAGIPRIGDRAHRIEAGELRPLPDDWVLLTVMAARMGNWDEFVRAGGPDVGTRPPMALEVEAADTVIAAGRAVSGSHAA